MSVSLVARQHGISGSQVFTGRRLMNQGALTAAAAGEEVVRRPSTGRLRRRCANCSGCWARRPWRTSLNGAGFVGGSNS